ncbi:MAG: hypothetical protein ACYC42_10435 [Lysobacter sp.]
MIVEALSATEARALSNRGCRHWSGNHPAPDRAVILMVETAAIVPAGDA